MLLSLLCWLLSIPAFCWNQDGEVNVNSRYTIEAVEFPGRYARKLSPPLKSEMESLLGLKFSQQRVDRISGKIRRELRGYRVIQKISKGAKPETIRVVYEVLRSGRQTDLAVPRLAYHSKQNLSYGVDAKLRSGGNEVSLGFLSDNDQQLERLSGIRGGYRRSFRDGRLSAGFAMESWRAQWNSAISEASASQSGGLPADIYRTRWNAAPEFRAELSRGVSLTAGLSFQRFQMQFPAARSESSNALVSSLRIQRRLEPSGPGSHTVEAGYYLRAATRSLGSDFAYVRHSFEAAYGFDVGHHSVSATLLAGLLNGRAPLFDRFILGNSSTLRGYNKYDVAPLGGGRMAHGSVDYRYRWLRAIYDTGTVYDRGGRARVLHSAAAGFTTGIGRDRLSLLLAFPLKEGRAEPILILGMNF